MSDPFSSQAKHEMVTPELQVLHPNPSDCCVYDGTGVSSVKKPKVDVF